MPWDDSPDYRKPANRWTPVGAWALIALFVVTYLLAPHVSGWVHAKLAQHAAR